MRCLNIGENLLAVVERRGGEDAGPALHIIVRVPPEPPQRSTQCFIQVWRADLFKVKPHQHFFFPIGDLDEDQLFLEGENAERPIDWCINELRSLHHIVETAGVCEIADKLEGMSFNAEIETIRTWLHEAASQ